METTTHLTLQRWGNSLALRIPAPVARTLRFSVGQSVALRVRKGSVSVRAVGPPKLSLTQKLAVFDPERHGGKR